MPRSHDIVRSTQPELMEIRGRLTGIDNANPTLNEGQGGLVSVTRSAEGKYLFKFRERYEELVDAQFTLAATDPDTIKGFTVHGTVLDKSAADYYSFAVWVYTAAAPPVLSDLIAAQYLHFCFTFRGTTIKV